MLRADEERAEAYDALALALGEGTEAQDAGDRAVTLFRALAPSGVRFAGALAHALHNQSVRLGVAGAGPADLARALDHAREAERRTAALEGDRPTAFRSLYADVLDNLAQLLAKTGDRSAAESTARRALPLRRSLAAARPDAYRPQLAATLNTLAVIRGGDDATDDQLQAILDAAGITGDELHHAQLEAVTRVVSGLPADEFIPAYAAAPAVRWSKGGIRPPGYLELHDEDWSVGLHEQGNREHLRAVVVAGVLIEALDRPERIVWLVPLLSAVVDPVTVEVTAAGLRFVLTRVPEPEIPAALADTVNPLDFADLVAAIARAPESITLGTGTTVVIRPAASSA